MANNLKIKKRTNEGSSINGKIDVSKNSLLGSYDSKGNYFISPKIMEELVSILKIKKTTFGNSLFCVAQHISFGELVFEITYDKYVEEGFSVATLYLLENIAKINGYLQNTIKTKICDYNDVIVDFIEKSYEFYNVEIDADDAKDKKLSADVFINMYITAKKQYEKAINSVLEKKLSSLYEKYFNKRMAALKSLDSEFASQVLSLYNKEFELIDNVFLQDKKDYRALNDLLDKSIEQVSGLSKELDNGEKEYNTLIEKDRLDFEKSIGKIYKHAESKAYIMLSKHEKEKMSDVLTDESIHEQYILDGKEETPFIVSNGVDTSNNETNELEDNTAQDDLESELLDKSDYQQTQYTQMESREERKKRLDALLDEQDEMDEDEKKSKAYVALEDMLSSKDEKSTKKSKTDPIIKKTDKVEEIEEVRTTDDGKAVIVTKKAGKKAPTLAEEMDESSKEEIVDETSSKKTVKVDKKTLVETPSRDAVDDATKKTVKKPEEKTVTVGEKTEAEATPSENLRKLQELRRKTSIPSKQAEEQSMDTSVVIKKKNGKTVVEPVKVEKEDVKLDAKKTAHMNAAQKENLKATIAKNETEKNQSEVYRQIIARQQQQEKSRLEELAKKVKESEAQNERLLEEARQLRAESNSKQEKIDELEEEKEKENSGLGTALAIAGGLYMGARAVTGAGKTKISPAVSSSKKGSSATTSRSTPSRGLSSMSSRFNNATPPRYPSNIMDKSDIYKDILENDGRDGPAR